MEPRIPGLELRQVSDFEPGRAGLVLHDDHGRVLLHHEQRPKR